MPYYIEDDPKDPNRRKVVWRISNTGVILILAVWAVFALLVYARLRGWL